jgi:TfuA protein
LQLHPVNGRHEPGSARKLPEPTSPEGGSAPPLVYVGPSLPLARASELLDADFRPPIRRGDLPRRYEGTIVIIDGEFHQALSVSPKEILRLLDQGTRVVGAASMGALRAVELSVCGMEGCGWIFDAYRSGRIDADDEVAVSYSPDDLSCLTVPLVNIRYWLDGLSDAGLLDALTAARLLAAARALFYADRTERRLFEQWDQLLTPARRERLLAWTGGRISDVKAADAELALALVRRSNITNREEDYRGSRQTAEPAGNRGAWPGDGR